MWQTVSCFLFLSCIIGQSTLSMQISHTVWIKYSFVLRSLKFKLHNNWSFIQDVILTFEITTGTGTGTRHGLGIPTRLGNGSNMILNNYVINLCTSCEVRQNCPTNEMFKFWYFFSNWLSPGVDQRATKGGQFLQQKQSQEWKNTRKKNKILEFEESIISTYEKVQKTNKYFSTWKNALDKGEGGEREEGREEKGGR